MERCWLKGSDGDALHAVLCAAGFNIRWLLRAIVRLGLAGLFLALMLLGPIGQQLITALASTIGSPRPSTPRRRLIYAEAPC